MDRGRQWCGMVVGVLIAIACMLQFGQSQVLARAERETETMPELSGKAEKLLSLASIHFIYTT